MMYSTPLVLLALTLLLPITTPHPSDAMEITAHVRQKREFPRSKLILDEIKNNVESRLAELPNGPCTLKGDGRCQSILEALDFLRLAPDHLAPAVRPQEMKKACAFSLGNHCLTESLDNAATEYGYLQSGNSPGRRRRRRDLGASPLNPRSISVENEEE